MDGNPTGTFLGRVYRPSNVHHTLQQGLRKQAYRQVCAQASREEPPLKHWQEEQLRQALTKGRKNIEVSKLCQQTQLERRRVLSWLKDPPPEDQASRSLDASQSPSSGAHQPWAPTRLQTPEPKRQETQLRTAQPRNQSQSEARGRHGSRQHNPASGTDFRASGLDRKFNKAILSTLELVFESTQSPNEEIIYSIVDLHHVPKRQVVDWFAEKRRQTRRAAQGMSR